MTWIDIIIAQWGYKCITEAINIISSYQNIRVSERDRIITLHILSDKKTISQSAKEYSLTYERIRQILYRTIRLYSPLHNVDELSKLNMTARTYNALHRSGIMSINDLIEAYENGTISNMQNLGEKGISEIKLLITKIYIADI